MTIVVGSVQIIPDRVSFVEELNWENKGFLFELIKENQRSRVIFLSGDIHSAQFYSTRCESLTGYNVPEFTSSGLTHHHLQLSRYADDLGIMI